MDRSILVNELQSLGAETKRKHPDVKAEADKALLILKGTTGHVFTPDACQILLAPVLSGCKTKITKVVTISIGALQRLVSLRVVSGNDVPTLLQTLQAASNQGSDVQLRIIQTLLLIMTYCPEVHGEVLGELLSIYFKLQDSKASVVSSTAGASLRQALVLVFERGSNDEKRSTESLRTVLLPDGVEARLTPNEWDAYHLFSDLCSLTSRSLFYQKKEVKPDRQEILRLSSITPTFGLELIESILSGFAEGFRKQSELIALLRQKLSPVLVNALEGRLSFPVMLRTVRVVFLLLRYFFQQIATEAETFWRMLIRGSCNEIDLSVGKDKPLRTDAPPPLWLRAMFLEVLKALCRDAALLHDVWKTFDAAGGSSVYAELVSALRRIISEKPSELGINQSMQGIGVDYSAPDSSNKGYFDIGLNAVSSAANAGVSTVSAIIGSESEGRLDSTSSLKVQCIEQHDKTEPNPIPERYPYLLALDMVIEVTDGLAVDLYSPIDLSGDNRPVRIEEKHGVIDLSEEHGETSSSGRLMLEVAWPALLASLSFLISTNLSDDLFDRVLTAIKTLIAVADGSRLLTCRDAFLNTLSKYAVPLGVLKAIQAYNDVPPTPGGEGLKNLIGNIASHRAPGLSDRNLMCLGALIEVARQRIATLNLAWHDILSTLQNANAIFGKQAGSKKILPSTHETAYGSPRFSSSSTARTPNASQAHQALMEADPDSVQGKICHLIVGTDEMEDFAFRHFIEALCDLSNEAIGIQDHRLTAQTDTTSVGSERTSAGLSHRRRPSGFIHHPAMRQGETSFALMMLDVAISVNIERLMTKPSDTAWDLITSHVLNIAQNGRIFAAVRMQAAEVLANLLGAATTKLEILDPTTQSELQRRVFVALGEQVHTSAERQQTATDLDIRTRGLQTLLTVLESSGHTIATVWPTVFDIIENIFHGENQESIPRGSQAYKAQVNLIRTAFPSLNLACSDYLSTFDEQITKLCFDSLCRFAGQQYDLNIALSSIGLMWNIMDAFQTGLVAVTVAARDRLWRASLDGMLRLTRSPQSQIRVSAIQTMFRSLESHGTNLSQENWNSVLEAVLLPLLSTLMSSDAVSEQQPDEGANDDSGSGRDADESQALVLASISSIYSTYSLPIVASSAFASLVAQTSLVTISACEHGGAKKCSAALRLCQNLCSGTQDHGSDDRNLKLLWSTITGIHAKLEIGKAPSPIGFGLTQDNLLQYLRLIELFIPLAANRWEPSQNEVVIQASRAAVSYTGSPTYALDSDNPSPLQQAGLDLLFDPTFASICPNKLTISALAEYITLAFVGGFEYVDTSMLSAKRVITKKVSYVGLTKAAMALTPSYLREQIEIDAAVKEGAVGRLVGALALPIKLRLDCPPANKFGKDPALWKTATSTLVAVLDRLVPADETVYQTISGDGWDSLWQQITTSIQSVLLTDDTYLLELDAKDRAQEEACDMPVMDLLHRNILPVLGHPSMNGSVMQQMAETLDRGSHLYIGEEEDFKGSAEDGEQYDMSVTTLPRESFRYRCFGLLFSSADRRSKADKNEEYSRRTSEYTLPLLMRRAKTVLTNYLAGASLRGDYPFERIREEELVYVLYRLSNLELWPGSFGALPGDEVSKQADDNVIHEALRQSSRAHLFYLYPILLEFVASPLRLPKLWVSPANVLFRQETDSTTTQDEAPADVDQEEVKEVDSRMFAKLCLDLIGREMGL